MSSSLNCDDVAKTPSKKDVTILRLLLVIATILFSIGIFTPMITVSKFVIVTNSFSIVSGVLELLSNGNIVLFCVVTRFSIVFPILKIIMLFLLLSTQNRSTTHTNRHLHLMHEYGRWAMLDVMVVAVLIVTVKLGVIASIDVHLGLFIFGGAVFLIMLITRRIVKLSQRQ